VKFVEVMGRHAGWVAAAAALGRAHPDAAPHLLYLPERPVTPEAVLADVEAAYRAHGHVVAVLSENQTEPTPSGPRVLGASGEPEWVDPFGHAYYASPAAYLCRRVRADLGLRARFDKPGSLQRSAGVLRSVVDEREAFAVGRAAVRAAAGGHGGCMVTLDRTSVAPYRCTTGRAPLAAIANQVRSLPAAFVAPTAAEGVTPAFATYARPLLGGPLPDYLHLPE
jgi:6-phosphofructokinase 1